MLPTGKVAELIDTSFHIVTSNCLAGGYRRRIDLIQYRFVGFDRPLGDVQTQRDLRPQHSKPQLPFLNYLAFGRPDPIHRLAGVATSKNIGHGVTHATSLSFLSRYCSRPGPTPTSLIDTPI